MSFSQEYLYMNCPWCMTRDIAMNKQGDTRNVSTSKQGTNRQWTWATCPRCGGAVAIETSMSNVPALLKIVPDSRSDDPQVKHLPEDVAAYYNNAHIALTAGIPSSAAVELRRALEAAAKHQGVEERTLVAAVKKMVEQGLVTKSFESVLSHVRKIGNQGAHATDEQLTEVEVRSAMEFTTQILRNLFEVPEELRLIQNAEDTTEN